MRFLVFILFLFLSSCARHTEDPAVAQMRVRAMQTRTFVGHNAKEVSKELLSLLQDEGYMVKTISHDLGLVTAEKDSNIEKLSSKFWSYFFSGNYKKHATVEITSNISEDRGNTKLRINFLVRVYDNLGRVVDVHQIFEEKVYLDFFNKIQKGLLL